MEKKKFGLFVKQARLNKGYTQKELADLLFVDVSSVSKWERGVSYPDITLIASICKHLEVSEKELIESSNDEEYRKMKKDAKNYKRISNSIFYGSTIAYAIAILTCFIVNISVEQKLSWFFLVVAGCLVGFSFVPTFLRFFNKNKLLVFIFSTFISLFLLYLTCSIYTNHYWFMIATAGTGVGYVALFLPIVFNKTKFSLSEDKFNKLKKWFMLIYSTILLILTIVIVVLSRFYNEFNVLKGLLITMYAYLILYIFGIISLLKTNVFTKLGLCFVCLIAYLNGLNFVLYGLLGGNSGGSYYDINFKDWPNHINGNVNLIVILSLLGLSILFLTIGIVLKRKKNR